MVKMVVSSFSNTLINEEEAISINTVLEIDRIRGENIKFCVCSNNTFKYIYDYNRDVLFIDYIISYAGGYIYDCLRECEILKKTIQPSILKRVHKHLNKYNPIYYTLNGVYKLDDDSTFMDYYKDNKNDTLMIVLDKGRGIINLLDEEKINYQESNKKIIINGYSKIQAFDKICKLCRVIPEEVVGIGYSEDDIPILSKCGRGVCVKNSTPKVLKSIKDVTLSNAEDGVYSILQQL